MKTIELNPMSEPVSHWSQPNVPISLYHYVSVREGCNIINDVNILISAIEGFCFF